jgi:hypothetical protein
MKKILIAIVGIFVVCFAVTCRKKDKDECPVCPQITNFSPDHGKAGIIVTINGSNFTTNPDGLQLKASINGFNATIKKIVDDQVQIAVPSKCGTGTIRLYYDDELSTESATVFMYDVNPIVSTFAGAGGIGSDDNPNPLLARFYYPEAVFLDVPRGIVYVIDDGGKRLRKIDGTGTRTILSGLSPIIQCGVCDASGNVFLSINGSIAKVNFGLVNTLTTIAGDQNTAGHVDGKGLAARFRAISALTIDASGNIYVGEDSYIRKMDALLNVSTIAGTGTIGFLDGPALSAQFEKVFSLALDNANNLFIADWKNNRMRKLSGGMVSTLAGNGIQGIVNGTGTAAQLQAPRSVAVDAGNTLYFSDSYTSIIRKITLNNAEVAFFSGSSTVSGDKNGVADTALFNQPGGFAYDKVHSVLYIADFFNSKIKKITFE